MLGNAASVFWPFCVIGMIRLDPWVPQCKSVIVLQGSGTSPAVPMTDACSLLNMEVGRAQLEEYLKGDIYS